MIRNALHDLLLLPTLSLTGSTRPALENVGPWGSCLGCVGNGVRDPTGRRGDDDGFTAVAAPPTRPLFSNMKRSRDSPGDRRTPATTAFSLLVGGLLQFSLGAGVSL